MNRITAWTLAACAAVLLVPSARAHDDATLDTMKAPHGGQLRMAGPYHLELVLATRADGSREEPVVVHVSDHAGTAEKTAGATGSVTLLGGGRKAVITLKPGGESTLVGQGRYVFAPDVKALVSVTLSGQPAYTARFTPGAQAGADHGHSKH